MLLLLPSCSLLSTQCDLLKLETRAHHSAQNSPKASVSLSKEGPCSYWPTVPSSYISLSSFPITLPVTPNALDIWPSCCSLNTTYYLPQGLATCHFLCLEHSMPMSLPDSFLHSFHPFSNVTFSVTPSLIILFKVTLFLALPLPQLCFSPQY